MPVLINEKTCVQHPQCYAALGCPYDAYYRNNLRGAWEVDAGKCGDCPAPCMNFCDANAVIWADNLFELDLVKAQLAGTMTVEQVAEARAARKAEDAAAAAAKAAATPAPKVIAVTAKTFQAEVLNSPLPVVMDCWAAWCGPCKQFAPIFAATAKEYAGVVKFVKLDTDAEPVLAQQLGIRALPTTLFLYKGQLVHGVQGAIPSVEAFSGLVQQVLLALRQVDPTLNITPKSANAAPDGADAPAGAGVPSGPSGLILGPDTGPPPAEPPPPRPPPPARRKPRLYVP